MFSKELVQQHYPGAIMIPAQKYWSLPENKKHMMEEMCDSGRYFGQIKEDGNFYQFVKGADGQCYLFSRSKSTKTKLLTEGLANVPHIQEAFDKLPNKTILLGEIFYPGGDSNMVRQIMGCLPKKAIARQNGAMGLIHYHIFDMIAFDGEMMLEMGALDRVKKAYTVFTDYSLGNHEFLHFAEPITKDLYQLGLAVLADGGEGMVLKDKNAKYTPEKKPAWSSIKFKKEDSADVVCMGYENAKEDYEGTEIDTWQFWKDSQGKMYSSQALAQASEHTIKPITKFHYYGMAGSMRIGAYNESGNLVEIGTVSSGLTDDLRLDLANNIEQYLNKVVKIDMMEKFKDSNTIRQPIFKGMHADKNADECTLADIFR